MPLMRAGATATTHPVPGATMIVVRLTPMSAVPTHPRIGVNSSLCEAPAGCIFKVPDRGKLSTTDTFSFMEMPALCMGRVAGRSLFRERALGYFH
jgi:hypothetical protein